jgi:hypothetical protein
MMSEIKKWRVFSGLSGGFGGGSEIGTFEGTEDEAVEYAWGESCNIFDSYSGNNGLRSVSDIMDDDNVEEEEAEIIYEDERESWLDYWVEEII